MDENTASKQHFTVGDTVAVIPRAGKEQRFRISGIVQLRQCRPRSAARRSRSSTCRPRRCSSTRSASSTRSTSPPKPGVSPSALLAADPDGAAAAHPGADGRAAGASRSSSDTPRRSPSCSYFLLAFGGIALFVGAFVIANTLSITIAQRTREFATLRARRGDAQSGARGSSSLEGFVTGAARLGRRALRRPRARQGARRALQGVRRRPAGDRARLRDPATVIVSIVVGIVVTLLASLRPALRATRVPPIAAVREGSMLPPSRLRPLRPGRRASSSARVSLALVVFARLRQRHDRPATGCCCSRSACSASSSASRWSRRARPPARLGARPARRRVIGGVAGDLARSNSMRNPSRTASTAAALMIGLALVTAVAVLAQGLQSAVRGRGAERVPRRLRADLAERLPADLGRLGDRAPPGRASRPWSPAFAPATAATFGKTIQVTAVDPGISKVLKMNWKAGLGRLARRRSARRRRRRQAATREPPPRPSARRSGSRRPAGSSLDLRVARDLSTRRSRRLAARAGHDLLARVRLASTRTRRTSTRS